MKPRDAHAPTSLDIVEAAYTMDADIGAWLARLSELARAFELGQGIVGYVQSAGGLTTPHFVAIGNDHYPQMLAALQELAPASWHEHFGRAMVASGSFRAFLAELGESPEVLGEVLRPFGVHDVLGVRAQDGHGWALGLVTFSERPIDDSRAALDRWIRVATHLGTALRLRQRIDRDAPDAILTPGGHLLEATTPTARGAVERLEAGVRQVDRARGALRRRDPDGALSLWEGLLAGRWSLVDRVDSDGRRFVLAYANGIAGPATGPLSERESAVVRWAVGGASNKEIAYALGLGTSTVGWHLSNAMAKLRVNGRVELIGLWREAHRTDTRGPTEATDSPGIHIVPLDRLPLPQALEALPTAEREVAMLAAEGHDNRAIAALRGSSPRTIANLLARTYQRLGIASRSELAALVSGADARSPGARKGDLGP